MQHFSPTAFPAPVVRRRTFGDFVLSETRYAAGASLAPHAHEYACLVAVLDGDFHERFGRRERLGEPGLVIVRPEGEPHSNAFGARGGRCLNVELSPRWLGQFATIAPAATRTIVGRRLHRELLEPDDLSPLAVESLVIELLAGAVRGPQNEPRWLARAKDLMHEEFATRLTLPRIAGDVGVHPVHLATTFRRFAGVTVAEYLRQLRLEFACRELVGSRAPLTDIAYAAGFADQSHFCRLFRRALRMTPREYRAAMRAEP